MYITTFIINKIKSFCSTVLCCWKYKNNQVSRIPCYIRYIKRPFNLKKPVLMWRWYVKRHWWSDRPYIWKINKILQKKDLKTITIKYLRPIWQNVHGFPSFCDKTSWFVTISAKSMTRTLRPPLVSCIQSYIAPEAMKPCVCTSLSPSLSLSLSPSLSLYLSLSLSCSPGRRHLTSRSARLQLSGGALRSALYSPQDYATMRLRPSHSLSPSLSPTPLVGGNLPPGAPGSNWAAEL